MEFPFLVLQRRMIYHEQSRDSSYGTLIGFTIKTIMEQLSVRTIFSDAASDSCMFVYIDTNFLFVFLWNFINVDEYWGELFIIM